MIKSGKRPCDVMAKFPELSPSNFSRINKKLGFKPHKPGVRNKSIEIAKSIIRFSESLPVQPTKSQLSKKFGISKQRLDQILNPEKHQCRWRTHHLVKAGKIQKPSKCSDCNRSARVEAHHPDYSNPRIVIWLCKKCHCKIHTSAKQLPHKKQNEKTTTRNPRKKHQAHVQS